ncbi:hypothetical protein CPC08DRAFT_711245 [Agrocybe pediades]|nr:hypothetical protein CPC08DRAFT_711245 [Agrocybe pediades]
MAASLHYPNAYSGWTTYERSRSAQLEYPYHSAEHYTSSEARSSSTMTQNQYSPSQLGFSTDVPELFYDHTWPSPTSASSSNIIATPPMDSQLATWQNVGMESLPEAPHFPSSQWQEPVSVPQIDANLDWKQLNPHKVTKQTSIPLLFTPLANFDANTQSFSPSFSFATSQPLLNPETDSKFRFSPPEVAFSSVPTDVSPPKPSPGSSTVRKQRRTRSPVSQIHHPAQVKIHQPRPSRQIPIISLSKLAAACDDISIHSGPKKSRADVRRNSNTRSSSSSTSLANVTHPSNNLCSLPMQHYPQVPAVHMGMFNSPAKSNACHCGCMQ